MITLSFSPKLLRQSEKFVVIPQREYELLLQAQKRPAKQAKMIGRKKMPAWLQASLRDVAEGRISGPFTSVAGLMGHLRQ